MPFVKTDSQHYTDIADAIRAKRGVTTRYLPEQMASAVRAIAGGVEHLSWHQCPAAVREYLAAAQAAYPTASDDYSCVHEYAPQGSNVSDEVSRATSKPIGYAIGGTVFYNNEPLSATPFATANKAGTLTALDRLRWINSTLASPAEGSMYSRGWNCRDLGGWDCDGGTVRYGMLIRGSEPNPVDKEMMVNQIGIKTEVQLLPRNEQPTNYKTKSPWGIDWAGNDTENVTVYSPADVSDPAKKALWSKILKAIIGSVNHSKPVYFHCGIGADRTGVTAMVLEGILGVSQSDVDIDFELTDFAIGWKYINLPSYGGDFVYRARNYPVFKDLKQSFDDIPLVGGLTDTFRNHCVSFALSLGITIDEINAFRSAMIDGTPDVIQLATTYTVSNSLSNCATTNGATAIEENAPYTATINPNTGYTLDGATVSITMGGADITATVYSNGAISIPAVTGNVVIIVSAVEIVRENLFDVSEATLNARIRGVGEVAQDSHSLGRVVTGAIDISNVSAFSVEGITEVRSSDNTFAQIALYSTSAAGEADKLYVYSYNSATYNFDVASLKAQYPTAAYARLGFTLDTVSISASDVSNLAIYGS